MKTTIHPRKETHGGQVIVSYINALASIVDLSLNLDVRKGGIEKCRK